MNSEYVVLGGWLWKMLGKKIGLWYVHKSIPWQLKVAEKFVEIIFTASRESCNIKSKKIKIIGHGVDLEKFKPTIITLETKQKFTILYVGRISPIKNQEMLIRATDLICRSANRTELSVKLIGGTIYRKDEEYLKKLKDLVKEKKLDDAIEFIGSVPYRNIIDYYNEADLAVNLCPTGGVDKAVLEAMACGLPILVTNKSFEQVFPGNASMLLKDMDEKILAGEILKIIDLPLQERINLGKILSNQVVENYSLHMLIKKIKHSYAG
jgi:glycosyltransferase involved in cell wall biosynthesis